MRNWRSEWAETRFEVVVEKQEVLKRESAMSFFIDSYSCYFAAWGSPRNMIH